MFREYSNKVEVKLDELILENGNIDGEKMEENWFPSVDADIFYLILIKMKKTQ